TFLRFWQNPRHELVRKPEAYLYQIASNVLAEHRLRQSRSLVTFDSEAALEHAEQPAAGPQAWSDVTSETHEVSQQLRRVLNQVPCMYRAALMLRTFEGWSFEEMGAKLGI